jgi:hypothetical protein
LPSSAGGQETKAFDVFISYNGHDRPAVREFAQALQVRGIKVWLDEGELIPGRPWLEALAENAGKAAVAAIVISRNGVAPWQIMELREFYRVFVHRGMPVIPVLLPGAPNASELPLFLSHFQVADLRDGLTKGGLDKVVWGITGRRP